MEKDIWENIKECNGKSKQNLINSKLRNYNFSMDWINLRNYINTYSIDKINVSTLESWFGDNLYHFDSSGNFIMHLLCILKYIPIEKRCKALEISFKILGPNLGTYNDQNCNFFQYCILNSRERNLRYSSNDLKKMYEIGLKYGLDINYLDNFNNSFVTYLLSISPFKIIDELCEILLTSENVSEWKKDERVLEKRTECIDMKFSDYTAVASTNIFSYTIKPKYNPKWDLYGNWNCYDYTPSVSDKKIKIVYKNVKNRINKIIK